MPTATKKGPKKSAKAKAKLKKVTTRAKVARSAAGVPVNVDPGRFEQLPLDLVAPSPTNPRKTFAGLEDLAESIRAHGVAVPILVRPVKGVPHEYSIAPADEAEEKYGVFPECTDGRVCRTVIGHVEAKALSKDHYEIVAGERRYRASLLAGRDTIPAIVRDLDDRAVLEIQVIENDQREDVHPMDQAAGYQLLIEQAGYDVPSLAAKIGRDETYVYRRLQLVGLIPELQEMLRNGDIHFGHALELARLTEADQRDLVGKDGRHSLFNYNGSVISVKELRDKIAANFHLDLANAPFPTDDATLVDGCVACAACSKRTGFNRSLFPDVDNKDTCTDRACFQAKKDAYVQIKIAKAKEKHGEDVVLIAGPGGSGGKGVMKSWQYQEVTRKEAKDLPPGQVKTAVVVDGDGVGKTVMIRVDREEDEGGRDPEREKKEREERKKREEKANELEALHTEILRRAVNAADGDPPVELLRAVAAVMLDNSFFRDGEDVFDLLLKECMGMEPPQYDGIGRFVADLDLTQIHKFFLLHVGAGHVEVSSHDPKTPPEIKGIAEAYDIDIAAVRKELKAAPAKEQGSGEDGDAAGGDEEPDDE